MDLASLEPLVQTASYILGPAGAAYVSVRVALNGQGKRLERIEELMDNVRDRLARLEGQYSKKD